MSTALPPSANSACSSGAGESAEYKFLQQCQMKRKEEWAVQDERGEEQPKKRCNHNLVMVSAEDFMMPEILQPIQTALAQEIDKFRAECEQWDPPNFEEEATDQGKPTFKLRNVYEHLQSIQAPGCHSTSTPAQKKAVYAVIKGLLALFHSDVDSSAFRSSPKEESAVNHLWTTFCSNDMRPVAFENSSPWRRSQELLALAVRQQMAADEMDRSKHIPRYVKYLADLAELCFLECDVSAARPDRHNEAVAEQTA